jgi:uncharacterized protein (TIGR03437 family)
MRLWLIALVALVASAQFDNFAVSDAGKLLFTSNLQHQSETVLNNSSKVFVVDATGISLFASLPPQNPPIPNGFGIVSISGVTNPLISGDGQIISYASVSFSVLPGISDGPRGSFGFPAGTFPRIAASNVQISRSGRFALGRFTSQLNLSEYNRYESGSAVPSTIRTTTFSDASNQPIANTGEFLVLERPPVNPTPDEVPLPDLLVAGSDAAMTRTKIADRVDFASISPDGRKIAFVQTRGTQRALILMNRDTGEQRLIDSVYSDLPVFASNSRLYHFSPMFANEGALLWQSRRESDGTRQLKYLAANGTLGELPAFDFGVTTAVIAGNGKSVYAATGNGRIVRIAPDTNEIVEIVPETRIPIAETGQIVVPGSRIRLFGFAPKDVVAFLEDESIPIVNRDLSTQGLQVPWNTAARSDVRNVFTRVPGNPFYRYARTLVTSTPRLNYETATAENNTSVPAVAHQDFRGLVSTEDPAAPGETIHVFARNLGPVDRLVATGDISPSDPPARIITPLACYLRELDQTTRRQRERIEGLTIPFAGLTAGSVGGYHIDITIPAEWPAGTHELLCQLNGEGSPITVAIGR